MRRHDPIPETQLNDADRKRLTVALAAARDARVYRRGTVNLTLLLALPGA
jgi:hypothetical protein